MTQLASDYGRYGYRRVTALLRGEGWRVNHKRIERLWRQEGLKVPQKQPKRRRLWLNDGARVRLRPQYKDHVWSYDFVADRTSDGRSFRMLTLIDEHTRECLAIDVARNLKSESDTKPLTVANCIAVRVMGGKVFGVQFTVPREENSGDRAPWPFAWSASPAIPLILISSIRDPDPAAGRHPA